MGEYVNEKTIFFSRSQSTNTEIWNVNNKLFLKGSDGVEDRSCLLPNYLNSGHVYVSWKGKEGDEGYKSIDIEYCGTEFIRCKTIIYCDKTVNPDINNIIFVTDGEYELSKGINYKRKKRK
jgi:hypothetical protein